MEKAMGKVVGEREGEGYHGEGEGEHKDMKGRIKCKCPVKQSPGFWNSPLRKVPLLCIAYIVTFKTVWLPGQ